MKKFLVLVLAAMLVLTFAACGGTNGDTSKADSSTAASEDASSEADESSKAESSKAETSVVSDDASSEDASSEATSEVSNDSDVVFTNKFMSWNGLLKTGIVNVRATDATSVSFSKINETPLEGDVAIFTGEFGSTIADTNQNYADFAVYSYKYDSATFSYKLDKSFKEGEDSKKASCAINKSGYVVAVHKNQSTYIKALDAAAAEAEYFVHGVKVETGLDFTVKKLSKAPTIDGVVNAAEYGGKPVWKTSEKTGLWNLSQFEDNNFYSSAEIYCGYDSDYFYVGVIVDSPYHINTLTEATKTSMYNSESIQINFCSVSPESEYLSEHFDYVIDPAAPTAKVLKQYGFCVNDSDETLNCIWIPAGETFGGSTVCKRDDSASLTYYEVALPWSEVGGTENPITVKKGNEFGFAISINSGDGATFKNIMMRDGGGIIGRNDFSKTATVTFG